MNILLINHEKGGGGASFSLYELICELLKKGHKIYVLTPYTEGLMVDRLKQLPVTILYESFILWEIGCDDLLFFLRLRIRWYLRLKKINIGIAKKIAKYALNHKIDVIHSNTSVINVGALISKYSGIPHVWHLREFGDLDIGMRFYEWNFMVYHFMNKYTNKFICVSQAISDYYSWLDNEKKIVVYNGVSASNINEDNHISTGIVNILIAGHIFEYKGQHEAVAACALLIKQGVKNFSLNIAGQGDLYFDIPEELRGKIKVWGEIRNVQELRKKMDIELICSKCEAFGRVTAEAMLGGLVVIGTNSGGTPELINHGYNGFLYERGDVGKLANLLKYLIENSDVRERIGKCARAEAKRRFLITRCADEVEKVYLDVIKQ